MKNKDMGSKIKRVFPLFPEAQLRMSVNGRSQIEEGGGEIVVVRVIGEGVDEEEDGVVLVSSTVDIVFETEDEEGDGGERGVIGWEVDGGEREGEGESKRCYSKGILIAVVDTGSRSINVRFLVVNPNANGAGYKSYFLFFLLFFHLIFDIPLSLWLIFRSTQIGLGVFDVHCCRNSL